MGTQEAQATVTNTRKQRRKQRRKERERDAAMHSCERKHRYETQDEAARNALTRSLDAYPCSYCGGWHVGHK
jgi:hypothetical protein